MLHVSSASGTVPGIYSEDKEQSYECVWDCRYQQLMLSYEYQSINICATFFLVYILGLS